MYTWGCKSLQNDSEENKNGSTCCNPRVPSLTSNGAFHKSRSSLKRSQKRGMDSISFKKSNLPSEKVRLTDHSTVSLIYRAFF